MQRRSMTLDRDPGHVINLYGSHGQRYKSGSGGRKATINVLTAARSPEPAPKTKHPLRSEAF